MTTFLANLQRSVSSYSHGDIIRTVIAVPNSYTKFETAVLEGSSPVAFVMNGTKLLTQWTRGARHPDGDVQLVELTAVVPDTVNLQSSDPVEIHEDDADQVCIFTLEPWWTDMGNDSPTIDIQITAHAASSFPQTDVSINLLNVASGNLDLDTAIRGPVFYEIEGGGEHPALGCYRYRMRLYRDYQAADVDFRWSTGVVGTSTIGGKPLGTQQPDRRFNHFKLVCPTDWTPANRLTDLDDLVTGNEWNWNSTQRGINFQFQDHRVRLVMKEDSETGIVMDDFRLQTGWTKVEGGSEWSLVQAYSPLTAGLLPLPDMGELPAPWPAERTNHLNAWNQWVLEEINATGSEWQHIGPYKTQYGNRPSKGGGVGIQWPPYAVLATNDANGFRNSIPQMWAQHMGTTRRRSGHLYFGDGTPFNPDHWAVGEDRQMPTNVEMQPDLYEGEFPIRHNWIFLNQGSTNMQGFDAVPVLSSNTHPSAPVPADPEVADQEATLAGYASADLQHAIRSTAEALWLAAMTNDWHAKDHIIARCCFEMLSYYDGTGGEFNATVGWFAADATNIPNQGSFYYRDMTWLTMLDSEAHRYCWDEELRATILRHLTNLTTIPLQGIQPNGNVMIDYFSGDYEPLNAFYFGGDTSQYRGCAKTWAAPLGQGSLMDAAVGVFGPDSERGREILSVVARMAQSQGMAWSFTTDTPSFSHVVGPPLEGPVYRNRADVRANEPAPYLESESASPGAEADNPFYLGLTLACTSRAAEYVPGDQLDPFRVGSLIYLLTASNPSTAVTKIQQYVNPGSTGVAGNFYIPFVHFVEQWGQDLFLQVVEDAPQVLLDLSPDQDDPINECLIESGLTPA